MIERATRMGELPEPATSRRGKGQMAPEPPKSQKRTDWRIAVRKVEKTADAVRGVKDRVGGRGARAQGAKGAGHQARYTVRACYPFRPCRADVVGEFFVRSDYTTRSASRQYVLSFACAAYASLPHL